MELCGRILVSKDKLLFTIKCTRCDADVGLWDDFVLHFYGAHNKNSKPWVDPLAIENCKDEFAINLIKDENICDSDIENEGKSIEEDPDISSKDGDGPMETTPSEEGEDCSFDDVDGDEDYEPPAKPKFVLTLTKRNVNTMTFIELYKNVPQLWNPKYKEYHDDEVRRKAEQDIIDGMRKKCQISLSEQAVRNAIQKIRSQYQHTAKQKEMPDCKISKVMLEYFEKCSFLSKAEDCFEDDIGEIEKPKNLTFVKMNPVTLALIETYADFPALYDPNHSDYSNATSRRQMYESISTILKGKHNVRFSTDDVQKSITYFRQWYYKLQSLQKSTNEQPLTAAQQLYLEKGSFLPPKITKKECSICSKACRTEFTMKVHLYTAHKIGEPPYKCALCDHSFETKASLQSHELRKHVGKVHQCDYCERRFAVIADLERHTRTHTGEKPFVCELCGKGFRIRTQLGYHMDAIHTKIRAYKCTMCPKDFLKKVNLDDHIKAHLNIRDKICETCGKGFTNCHSLIRHRQIHSEVKKFACKMCDAKFHQFVGLNSHMKRTHNIVRNQTKNNPE